MTDPRGPPRRRGGGGGLGRRCWRCSAWPAAGSTRCRRTPRCSCWSIVSSFLGAAAGTVAGAWQARSAGAWAPGLGLFAPRRRRDRARRPADRQRRRHHRRGRHRPHLRRFPPRRRGRRGRLRASLARRQSASFVASVSAGDDDHQIGYQALPRGVPIVTADGVTLGTVAKVLDNAREHIFDGIVMKTDKGRRFVDAPEVARISLPPGHPHDRRRRSLLAPGVPRHPRRDGDQPPPQRHPLEAPPRPLGRAVALDQLVEGPDQAAQLVGELAGVGLDLAGRGR